MKLIAHRGNINGRDEEQENNPIYISKALESGYDAEIDVWYINKEWYLGHDKPQYKIEDYSFFSKKGLWLHAKNGDAFFELLKDTELNIFWHTNEDWILTSKGYIWTYPNKTLYPNSICVLPELGFNGNIKECHGICSDYIVLYNNL